MVDELELFNTHQEDVRRRADSLCRAVFVLSGGTLTVSIGIFTREATPMLTQNLSRILIVSWWALFLTIIVLVVTLTVIVARDYAFGERWRKKIDGKSVDITGTPAIVEVFIWFLAICGLLGFLVGMLGQAYVAGSLL